MHIDLERRGEKERGERGVMGSKGGRDVAKGREREERRHKGGEERRGTKEERW